MSRGLMERICEGAEKFRVWPDGTVQSGDEAPHTWMSDNFKMVWALNE